MMEPGMMSGSDPVSIMRIDGVQDGNISRVVHPQAIQW
jgi:hypothetical protein